MVKTIREGTPLQIMELLSSLEASGDIETDEDIVQDEIPADAAMLEMDAEIDISDEDEPALDQWGDDASEFTDAGADFDNSTGPFAPRKFEIVISDGACYVPVNSRCIRKAISSTGRQVLYELESRITALKRMAAWLTAGRPVFLRTQDLWYLGCEALADIREGRIPVMQKSFLKCAGLWPEVSESSLSRYIRATELAWPDGSCSLDILFSDQAKRAWVANAVKQFVEEMGERVTEAMLAEYAFIQVSRDSEGRRKLGHMSSDSMDLPTFIKKANMLARTRWEEVLRQYRARILGQE